MSAFQSERPTARAPAEEVHLVEKQLAKRWGMSHRTLQRWRCKGQGPAYLKLCGHVVYRLIDVLSWEQDRQHRAGTTSDG